MYGNANFGMGILIMGALLGAVIMLALFFAVPWLIDLIKPWLHAITA